MFCLDVRSSLSQLCWSLIVLVESACTMLCSWVETSRALGTASYYIQDIDTQKNISTVLTYPPLALWPLVLELCHTSLNAKHGIAPVDLMFDLLHGPAILEQRMSDGVVHNLHLPQIMGPATFATFSELVMKSFPWLTLMAWCAATL
jgi:hypothetical protein